MSKRVLPKLTPEQIQSLQVDEALRHIGTLSALLVDVNAELGEAMATEARARGNVLRLREEKRTIVELSKSLGCIAKHA